MEALRAQMEAEMKSQHEEWQRKWQEEMDRRLEDERQRMMAEFQRKADAERQRMDQMVQYMQSLGAAIGQSPPPALFAPPLVDATPGQSAASNDGPLAHEMSPPQQWSPRPQQPPGMAYQQPQGFLPGPHSLGFPSGPHGLGLPQHAHSSEYPQHPSSFFTPRPPPPPSL
ncbi:unnamed protein product [Urochloa humidicola]